MGLTVYVMDEGESSCDNHKLKVNANCVDRKKSNIDEDYFKLIESVDTNDQEQTIISDPDQNEVLIVQVYKYKATLKSVMTQYANRNRFQFNTNKSNGNRYTLICKSKECGWFLMASSNKNTDLFKIEKFRHEHTCPLKNRVYQQKHVSSTLIGGIVKQKLSNHKRMYTAKNIQEDIKNDLGLNLTYTIARRSREKALISLRGTTYASYNRLPGYLYMMKKTYPGFDSCRPIVVIDGSHLRVTYNGTFVSARHIFSLAYGILDSENYVTWSWFFEQLKEAQGIKLNMCVVSDRNEIIIRAVSTVYGGVVQYACIWHLWENVVTNFRKSHAKLSKVFYAMAKTYTISEFNNIIKKVEKIDIRVKDYLQSTGYNKWSRVYETVNRGFTLTSNIVETINRHLKKASVEEKNLEPDNYCSDFYKPNSVLETYEVQIFPLPDRSTWKIPNYILTEVVLPPKYRHLLEGQRKEKSPRENFTGLSPHIHAMLVG
ncbi:uncharacterized protein LOC107857343 [Capsicum annuum]|uniref:uncharacterized protein LOC107857343 n=1 Tax=Capsicum annuum TaxID=4072 RepID=UPI001FB1151D|nr:uncharacterized protein LOC107857343 [Capsicum annuum]